MPRKTGQRLSEVFDRLLDQATASGAPQKTKLICGPWLRIRVESRVASLLIADRRPIRDADVAVIANVVPRAAERRPRQGQHAQQIGDVDYFAVEFRWALE